MTAQIPDHVIYQGKEYDIIGVRGKGLITPADFDLFPAMMSTACYRGYVAHYTVIDDRLVLTRLQIRTRDDHYPPIEGVAPTRDSLFNSGLYDGLHVPVEFTGGLLIACDFIQARYVHMGFQKPTSFRTVYELLVNQGEVRDSIDFSQEIASIREGEITRAEARERRESVMPDKKELKAWIDWMFSLDYSWFTGDDPETG